MTLAITTSFIGQSVYGNKSAILRADLPDYVFEFDLKKYYPSTWQFYKKLDITNRDKVYSFYLYNPTIQKVRHKIFTLALGKGKGKSLPRPVILSEIMFSLDNKDKKSGSSFSLLNSVDSLTNSPAISNFDPHSHQSIYAFLKDN
ncbi:MAG TPA: hypothetical protein EYH35_03825 [Thiotrichaceae bacterium]|nr:hypothetical protein [Thiotrichaceae bacterium]